MGTEFRLCEQRLTRNGSKRGLKVFVTYRRHKVQAKPDKQFLIDAEYLTVKSDTYRVEHLNGILAQVCGSLTSQSSKVHKLGVAQGGDVEV